MTFMKNGIVLMLIILFQKEAFSQNIQQLQKQIHKISLATKSKVGVGLMNLETNEKLLLNNEHHYPMQSVFKFMLGMAVLHEVDNKKFSFDQKIHITKKDLLPFTWSPIREKYPEGEVDLPLSEIIFYTVSESDNNGCDILFKLMGGVKKVEDYFRKLGIKDLAIVATEGDMHKSWPVQFTNYTTPSAMLQVLQKLNDKKTLSAKSQKFLLNAMISTPTSNKRIKYLLPKGTIIAHKTGTSGRNKSGVSGGINDVGIVTLPNGQHLAIAVFITNARESDEIVENVIAQISKAAYDYYVSKK